MKKFTEWCQKQRVILIDSAMGLGLKERGYNLNNQLWTAKALIDRPDLVYQTNLAYFNAGSNVTSTDSYQADPKGFLEAGDSKAAAEKYIKESVQLAQKARNDSDTPQRKWIGGAVGPYGAYLADGSEYTGNYRLTEQQYVDFHADRIKWLIEAGCDLLQIKTMPNFNEIQAVCKLIKRFPDVPAYVTCSLRDAHHISDGTDLRTVQSFLEKQPQVIAYGFNCFKPAWTVDAIQYVKATAKTNQSLVAVPNAGGKYDPRTKKFGKAELHVFSRDAPKWINAGAKWIGGCCEISEKEFSRMHAVLVNNH